MSLAGMKYMYDSIIAQSDNSVLTPQWAAADAEIKVPSGDNTELKILL